MAVIKAVDEYADLMRVSVASAGNDHRLGANEAPPAIVSIFLGDELTAVLNSIENDTFFGKQQKIQMETGAAVLPHFSRTTLTGTVPLPLLLLATSLNSVCWGPPFPSQVPTLY